MDDLNSPNDSTKTQDLIDRTRLSPGTKVRICSGDAYKTGTNKSGTIKACVGGEGWKRRYLVQVGGEIREYSRRTLRKVHGMRTVSPQPVRVEVETEITLEATTEGVPMSRSIDIRSQLVSWSKPPSGSNPVKYKIGAEEPPVLVFVNAERARQFLGLAAGEPLDGTCSLVHPRNRDSSMSHVEKLANEIVSNSWMATHQGGALDRQNRVLDFVHRLKAVILADEYLTKNGRPGVFVPMWIFPNCDPAMFHYIDGGFNRNQQHRFIARGGKREHAAKVCAIGRSMVRGISSGNFNLTLESCVEATLKHQDLIRKVLAACHYGKKSECPYYSNGWSGAFAKAALEFGESKVLPLVHKFVNQRDMSKATASIPDGAALAKNDPMKVLHDFLQDQKTSRGTEAGHVRDWMQYPYAVTAIRAALAGDTLTSNALKMRTRDVAIENKGEIAEKKRIIFKVEDFAKDFAKSFNTASKLTKLKESAVEDDDSDEPKIKVIKLPKKMVRAPKALSRNRELVAGSAGQAWQNE